MMRFSCPRSTRSLCWRLLPLLLLLLLSLPTSADQPLTGRIVYRHCIVCHGLHGEGSADGESPRLAGMAQDYIERQLHTFKNENRINKPMLPIFQHAQFDDNAIRLVSEYLAELNTPRLNLWPYRPNPAARAAFDDHEAYIEAGRSLYRTDCAQCHGDDGTGNESHAAPPLVQQYPRYLLKQINDFTTGEREHEHSDRCIPPDDATADSLMHYLIELGHRASLP